MVRGGRGSSCPTAQLSVRGARGALGRAQLIVLVPFSHWLLQIKTHYRKKDRLQRTKNVNILGEFLDIGSE